MKIDIFCHVIDYFGDVAVTYRLARALSLQQSDLSIRFFCTHPEIITRLYPDKNLLPITVYDYDTPHKLDLADVAIEAFACELPKHYIKPALIINLEYLTAENWITEYHELESIGMNPAGKKFFFFPSIDDQAGSLTHGDFLQCKKTYLHNKELYKQQLTQELSLPIDFLDRPWLVIYAYALDPASWSFLAESFAIIHIETKPAPITSQWIATRRCSQKIFDMLLILSDMLIIRGEDSLSRALLTGKPFLWQAYKQEEEYHLIKVEALYQRLTQMQPNEAWLSWHQIEIALNQQNTISQEFFLDLMQMSHLFQGTATKIAQYESLEKKLLAFIQQNISL
ncbi:elongation factor P maturation arginine rhamnosyltransferase EarP [Entomospira entomophila]|uniref:Protein-arginine rhamnosyltransferase n=1 Tax=Entomospira entomophila TaxID=2719988 RepID=A0A968GC72_9SPIO|nr:elongation factor P maturation arginine rhamnosyltransferase EarP [Entomospira entomophilus]NIZ40269.1 elongation factor P maturation arginine rhamnosyltransferase EarP [Entomospira entomophilus]WDI35828.1 elongation factor P maturation arginine rhamnosyltransferase EarP [Entomospira entomophilus]